MKQHLFFDEAVRLIKFVWTGIAISGLCISFSMLFSPVFWFGIVVGAGIAFKTLSVYSKKSKLIRRDYDVLLPHPFRTSSIISLLVSVVMAIISDVGFLNPWAMGFLVAGILFAVAKTIEPRFYWEWSKNLPCIVADFS